MVIYMYLQLYLLHALVYGLGIRFIRFFKRFSSLLCIFAGKRYNLETFRGRNISNIPALVSTVHVIY